jgi:tRNA pseudouridine32 synthase / 23S rRNA pseudouridine746 synthase
MRYFNPFPTEPEMREIPEEFPDPCANQPHELACKAAELLQQSLALDWQLHDLLNQIGGGKMFGVLVVRNPKGRVGYLSSFSGMLNQQWHVPGFVPPAFDVNEMNHLLKDGEQKLAELTNTIDYAENCHDRLRARKEVTSIEQSYDRKLSDLRDLNLRNREIRHQARCAIKNGVHSDAFLKQLSVESQSDKKLLKQLTTEKSTKWGEAEQYFDKVYGEPIRQLKITRKELSQGLQHQVFDAYRLINTSKQSKSLWELFDNKQPPAGTGDCAAPKLLQFAFKHDLQPLALAEFWWGAVPIDTIRHQGHFYSPCRSKCQPILPFMLKGIFAGDGVSNLLPKLEPRIVFEDEAIVVVEKPEGLLSVPGKSDSASVLRWLKNRYPEATGPLLVHRLDMATSGLLIAGKTAADHRELQRQFMSRQVEKRYFAILDGIIDKSKLTIDLPLRVDLDDRPRQMVCQEYGKSALTEIEVISEMENQTRVCLYPRTGRTHQLRIHAAHPLGLAAPIVGDPLYGKTASRLMLHAEQLILRHPRSGAIVKFESPVPF